MKYKLYDSSSVFHAILIRWFPGRREEHGRQLQRDREAVPRGGRDPGDPRHPGRGGRPRDAGAGLQHGPRRREPHEARLRSQNLSYPQRLSKCQRGHFFQLKDVQRNAGKKMKLLQLFCFKVKGEYYHFQSGCDRNLTSLRDDLATDLFELEEEYYSSSFK